MARSGNRAISCQFKKYLIQGGSRFLSLRFVYYYDDDKET